MAYDLFDDYGWRHITGTNQVVFSILNKHILTVIWYFTLWIESALLLPKGKATLSQLDNNTSAKIWLFF